MLYPTQVDLGHLRSVVVLDGIEEQAQVIGPDLDRLVEGPRAVVEEVHDRDSVRHQMLRQIARCERRGTRDRAGVCELRLPAVNSTAGGASRCAARSRGGFTTISSAV